ncbi:MAG: hypothetical protein IJ644_05100 [Oscillospiraceae bacterium]|nr:hypothetical protein [Oscillospiraceae bacterium]
MLRILEQKNLERYQEIIQNLNLPENTSLHLTEALDDADAVKGYILYAYHPEQIGIYALNDGNDWDYCDGLVRSVLFKAQLRGIERAVFEITNPEIRERIQKLGFVKNNQNSLENISEVMESCKKCKENPSNT